MEMRSGTFNMLCYAKNKDFIMNYYFWSDPRDPRGKFPVPGIPHSPGTKNVRGIPTPTVYFQE